MKLLTKILLILSLFITTNAYSDPFKSKRAEAVTEYNNNNVKSAFQKLKRLVKQGDSESAFVIGILLIKGNSGRDAEKAFDWFEVSAKMCNPRSLEFLKSKYLERGGVYFKPARLEYIKSKCANYKKINKKFAEKSKIKKLNKKPEKKKIIKKTNKEKLVQKPKQTKPLENQYSEQTTTNDNYVISENVKNSWKKIIPYKNELKRIGYGSGFAISKNGHFLTNDHVISGCVEVDVLYNKMLGKAQVLKTNKSLDAAILKVKAMTPYYLNFDDKNFVIGERLYAAGYPFTLNLVKKKLLSAPSLAFSSGELVNTELLKSNRLIISVPIASGNSGGPVIGKYGLVRGQITSGFKVEDAIKNAMKKRKFGKHIAENITYSVMSSSILLKNWINNTNILRLDVGKRMGKLDSDDIGEIATYTVAYIACYG